MTYRVGLPRGQSILELFAKSYLAPETMEERYLSSHTQNSELCGLGPDQVDESSRRVKTLRLERAVGSWLALSESG